MNGSSPARNERVLAALPLLALLASACANPVPPTGGPTDQEPPRIVNVVPEDQSVHVDADRLTITFSEYVEQASFARAFSITPRFSRQVDLSWRGRTVTVRFPEPLRGSTTYIIDIDTNLRDVRGVALRSPITLAFSSGGQIDQGSLSGRVVGAARGSPIGGIDVYAYRGVDPDTLASLPPLPDYRTQTDADGRFTFRHLPHGASFYVVALADENRNRAAEPMEPFAAPRLPSATADSARDTSLDDVWVLDRRDTEPPVVQRLRQLSSRRIGVRFSEPVILEVAESEWQIQRGGTDSVGAAWLYLSRDDAREVIAVSDSLSPGEYDLIVRGVRDSTGNVVSPGSHTFSVVPIADTIRARFVGFSQDTAETGISLLRPDEFPTIDFSSGMRRGDVEAVTTVMDSAGISQPYTLSTETGTTWYVQAPPLHATQPVTIRVDDPAPDRDSVHVRRFARMDEDELGEISGHVSAEGDARIVVEFTPESGNVIRVEPDVGGRFLVKRLPAGQYFVRAFEDRDSSYTWSGGRITPYQLPERITWQPDSVRVRARWETAMEDTLWLMPLTVP